MKVKRRGTDGPIYDALPGYSLPDCYEIVNEAPNEPKIEERVTRKFKPADRVSWVDRETLCLMEGRILSAHGSEDEGFYRIQRDGEADLICVFESDLTLIGDSAPARDYEPVSTETLDAYIASLNGADAALTVYNLNILSFLKELRDRRRSEKAVSIGFDPSHQTKVDAETVKRRMEACMGAVVDPPCKVCDGSGKNVMSPCGCSVRKNAAPSAPNPFDPTAKKTARTDLP